MGTMSQAAAEQQEGCDLADPDQVESSQCCKEV